MRHRNLRIALSAFCGLACVLLLALWYRSYWTLDLINRCDSRHIMTTIGSQMGTVYFAHFDAYEAYKGTGNSYATHGWEYRTREAYALKQHFRWKRGSNSLSFNVPHWLPAIVAILVGAAIWLPLRFSLRTLLIATTLVAVLLKLPAISN